LIGNLRIETCIGQLGRVDLATEAARKNVA